MKQSRNTLWLGRMILVDCWFVLVSVCMLPISLLRFGNTANNLLFVKAIVSLGRKILGFKVTADTRNLPAPDEPCVYIMNHQAGLDVMMNAEVLPARCAAVVKRSLLLIPVFGWLLYLNGNVLLNRRNQSHSRQKMNEADEAIKVRRVSIWIFPEGTRSQKKGLGKFKKGAFHLAINNQVPIVPIVASSYHKGLNFSRLNAGQVFVEVLPPVPTAGLTVDDLGELITRCENLMGAAIARLDTQFSNGTEKLISTIPGRAIDS